MGGGHSSNNGGSSGSNLAFIGVGATRQTMYRGATVNTQVHQALSLNGANTGRGGPGGKRGMKWRNGPHCVFSNCG